MVISFRLFLQKSCSINVRLSSIYASQKNEILQDEDQARKIVTIATMHNVLCFPLFWDGARGAMSARSNKITYLQKNFKLLKNCSSEM